MESQDDQELFDRMARELYSAVIADSLDSAGATLLLTHVTHGVIPAKAGIHLFLAWEQGRMVTSDFNG